MQMDVRDMSFFPDDSFGGIIDKGISSLFLLVQTMSKFLKIF